MTNKKMLIKAKITRMMKRLIMINLLRKMEKKRKTKRSVLYDMGLT